MPATLTDQEVFQARESGVLTCRHCGASKPLAQFVKSPSTRLGVITTCKRCRADKEIARWHKTPAGQAALARMEFERSPEYRAEVEETSRAKRKEWERRNREGLNQWCREWARKHPELRRAVVRKSDRKRRLENPEATRRKDQLNNRAAKARRRGAERRLVTHSDITRQSERQHGCCFYCGESRPLTLEHVIPVCRGGRHAVGNLVLACVTCNSSKGPLLVVEWRARRPRTYGMDRRI